MGDVLKIPAGADLSGITLPKAAQDVSYTPHEVHYTPALPAAPGAQKDAHLASLTMGLVSGAVTWDEIGDVAKDVVLARAAHDGEKTLRSLILKSDQLADPGNPFAPRPFHYDLYKPSNSILHIDNEVDMGGSAAHIRFDAGFNGSHPAAAVQFFISLGSAPDTPDH